MNRILTSCVMTVALSFSANLYAAEESHGGGEALTEADIPTLGNAEAGAEKAATCAACHGPAGNSGIAENPSLAGQSAPYIYDQLMAFKSGDRANAIMASQVTELEEQDMKDLATYFSQQQPLYAEAGEGDVELGESIYLNGLVDQSVPSCMGCHGVSGGGMLPTAFPSLAGQHATYIESRLNAMAENPGVSENAQVMHDVAIRMRPGDRAAVASYIQGLKP